MRLLRRLPIYAIGFGFGVALIIVADVRGWNGWETFIAAVVIGVIYVAILVPWLLREQLAAKNTHDDDL